MKKIISLVILLSMAITSIGIVSAYSDNDAKASSNYQIGDINKDGKINVKDAVFIQKKIVNRENFSAEEMYLADVNTDGQVTVSDATAIQKYANKMISSLPIKREDETTTSTTKPSPTTQPTLTTDPDGYFDIVVKP